MSGPNCGAGSRNTRKDAIRWQSVHSPNCVTRAVCRDIWAEWAIADDCDIKRQQDATRELSGDVSAMRGAFNSLGQRLGYGGVL